MNNKYTNPIILDDVDLNLFFHKNDLENAIKNNKKLMMTNKGIYSITKYDDAQWITDCIIDTICPQVNKEETNILYGYNIIDATACIGGNTINFAKYFFNVIAIELNKIHYSVLKNNINALNINNVTIHEGNFLDIIKEKNIKSDIIFIDPPWGGFQYKVHKYFNLKLGNIPINEVIEKLLVDFEYVVLKAPINLNLNMLKDEITFYKMNIYKNIKNNLLLITFKKQNNII
jgi:16S rRNA G966 N2-methylase RsmD